MTFDILPVWRVSCARWSGVLLVFVAVFDPVSKDTSFLSFPVMFACLVFGQCVLVGNTKETFLTLLVGFL